MLERVHYWADEPQNDHRPERKSEVLMLGVSSRKPSVTPRQPPRRHQRPLPPKYQDFSYKLTDNFPMTILVPPPLPPPGLQPILFILNDDKPHMPTYAPSSERPIVPERPVQVASQPSIMPSHQSSLYALQEANLIYHSSTTHQDWLLDLNKTNTIPTNSAVSSDYAGWGPTTPIDDQDNYNESNNFIFHGHHEMSRHPFSFYRPMLSESPPPPPQLTPHPIVLPAFLPTALPPLPTLPTTTLGTPSTETQTEQTRTVVEDDPQTTTNSPEGSTTEYITFQPTTLPAVVTKPQENLFGMFNSMISMPLVNGPERPEDALYAHASENIHVYKEKQKADAVKLESMQTMHPPPLSKVTESTTPAHRKPPIASPSNSINTHEKPNTHTLDPYIHLRFTTPAAVLATDDPAIEASTGPPYLIIQGHSKVKTYSTKLKQTDEKQINTNEIPRPNETKEVKHLHPLKEKYVKKIDTTSKNRNNNGRNLKSLLDEGIGSIEIQEADVGIKYDVSDGSEVPVEIYRKGFVESDENDYTKKSRPKRQIGLEDLLPFDEEQVEEYIFKFLEGKKNHTGIAGLIATAVTSDTADAIDDLEEEEDEDEDDER